MPRLVTLFPEPDSPTIPRVRPRSTLNENAVHRLDQAVLGRELNPQVLDLKQGVRHQYLTLGSSTA